MRKFFTYGSVRGAAGNGGPYRDKGDIKAYIPHISVEISHQFPG